MTRRDFPLSRWTKTSCERREQRDGHYLLRTNLTAEDPAVLWTRYVQLTQIEAVFRSLKSDLGIRPIYHRLEHRVDAHILIAFLAYCLQVTLEESAADPCAGIDADGGAGETRHGPDDRCLDIPASRCTYAPTSSS